jgi:hypothetical protein
LFFFEGRCFFEKETSSVCHLIVIYGWELKNIKDKKFIIKGIKGSFIVYKEKSGLYFKKGVHA